MDSIFNLKGKIALITGGAGVLGSNFANVLAKQGVIVGIVSQSLEKAESTVKTLEANGGQGFAVQANVLNKEEVEKVRDFNYPVCFDFPVGHQRANYAYKLGIEHKLIVKDSEVTLTEIV